MSSAVTVANTQRWHLRSLQLIEELAGGAVAAAAGAVEVLQARLLVAQLGRRVLAQHGDPVVAAAHGQAERAGLLEVAQGRLDVLGALEGEHAQLVAGASLVAIAALLEEGHRARLVVGRTVGEEGIAEVEAAVG